MIFPFSALSVFVTVQWICGSKIWRVHSKYAKISGWLALSVLSWKPVFQRRGRALKCFFNSTLTWMITRKDFTTSMGVFVVENIHCKFESSPFTLILQVCSLYLIRIVFQFGPYMLFGRPRIWICKYQPCSKLLLLLFCLFVFVLSKPYVTICLAPDKCLSILWITMVHSVMQKLSRKSNFVA
jgi:hypothetical protein